ncbi:hypothetical protein Suden_1873 [Sulfurimonas denitrificans DSM 1251]|uniref:DUF2393 domain-containing protein n=1 Tax=Sulfurimonas denitrificans (strain ATCC 33889 / DSM 1251) TaxID=326298 RepID=Q30PD4_SULDN|nr:DUF2393 domain-containing protein [Sulfurimonas denitrificans]ABB45147.1 hypothetical protein Suden_1873 [Sulfurimonas denitrificans DSM 1251]MDD3442786.1 DUF2393 domain-containing protein [Sulfurimonas denitrificans]
MITLFNFWHYLAFTIGFIVLGVGVFFALKQKKQSMVFSIIFSVLLITILMSAVSIVVIDKYTKIAKLYKLENKRNLSTEQIMYSGIVRNEGDYEIGEVTFEIKLVNKGHVSGNVKAGTFFSPRGFFDFFDFIISDESRKDTKPQQIEYKFVVAKNLKPKESQEFRVYFDYPPYFSSVSHFSNVSAH